MPIVIGIVVIVAIWVIWVAVSGSKSPDPIEDRLDFFTGGRDA
jgi:hypothetical protein